ncbi:MAG: PP2C family protein-serine/threonine phosphatase [Lachnospiraceae bacterium]
MAGIVVLLIFCVGKRLELSTKYNAQNKGDQTSAVAQTTGNKEIQSDCAQVHQNDAGMMAVLADGIGRQNTGKIAAQVAVDTVLDAFEPYRDLNNPEYLFRTALLEANRRIQQTIGERRGGASMGVVFMNRTHLYYALVGNIRIALLRNDELIPLSKGHTISVLAQDAYQEGLLSKNETLWSIDEKQIWNYLGKDGFREIEIGTPPVSLKNGDMIVIVSQGIFDELSWAEIEDILLMDNTMEEKAEHIIIRADKKETADKENGSVLLLTAEVG